MQDGYFSPGFTEGFDHGFASFFSSTVIIGGHLSKDINTGFVAGNIYRNHWNPSRICFLDHRNDRSGFARAEDDRGNLADDKVSHLIGLLGNILICAEDYCFVALLCSLRCDVVSDDFEKWIFECKQ